MFPDLYSSPLRHAERYKPWPLGWQIYVNRRKDHDFDGAIINEHGKTLHTVIGDNYRYAYLAAIAEALRHNPDMKGPPCAS